MSFFVLEKRLWTDFDTEFVQADPIRIGEAPRCPVCGAATEMRPWLPPHHAELIVHGHDLGDAAYGPSASFLFSGRLSDAYRTGGFRGLHGFEPVEFTRIQPSRFAALKPIYLHVRAIVSQAALDDSASGVTRTGNESCAVCRTGSLQSVRCVVLEPGTWQGEDLFEARGLPGITLTSQRFRNLVDHHRFTNIVLTPAEEYSVDFTRKDGVRARTKTRR